MRFAITLAVLAIGGLSPTGWAAEEVSVERGRLVSIISGCQNCHTEGYSESEGKIDPTKEMMGSSIGWQGPWGTTYARNLRRTAGEGTTEDGFVQYLKTLRALPPMPWYNVRAMPESDLRSLYRYLKSLDPVDPRDDFTPASVPPGEEPKTPFIVLAPPQMPKPCSRDLDCRVGQVCGAGPVRTCVAK
jgi:hypothetical protein